MCHVQSLEKDFYFGSFDHVFTPCAIITKKWAPKICSKIYITSQNEFLHKTIFAYTSPPFSLFILFLDPKN